MCVFGYTSGGMDGISFFIGPASIMPTFKQGLPGRGEGFGLPIENSFSYHVDDFIVIGNRSDYQFAIGMCL